MIQISSILYLIIVIRANYSRVFLFVCYSYLSLFFLSFLPSPYLFIYWFYSLSLSLHSLIYSSLSSFLSSYFSFFSSSYLPTFLSSFLLSFPLFFVISVLFSSFRCILTIRRLMDVLVLYCCNGRTCNRMTQD